MCPLAAGRRAPGNEEALLACFGTVTLPAAENLPSGHGFNVERLDLHGDGRTWLALTRAASGSQELFLAMARDMTYALDAESGSGCTRMLRVFLGRVRAWQEFMRRDGGSLTPESEIGLVGELKLMSDIVAAGVPVATAAEAWVGPLGGIQDFELGTGAIEAKTTLSTAGMPARIGSLQQLDDSTRKPLFVAGRRLRLAASGKALPEVIADARTATAGDPEARRLLSDRLLAAGYLDMHADRYARKFITDKTSIFEVVPGFPRLTPSLMPPGVLSAMYDIDLAAVPGPAILLHDALKKLGIL